MSMLQTTRVRVVVHEKTVVSNILQLKCNLDLFTVLDSPELVVGYIPTNATPTKKTVSIDTVDLIFSLSQQRDTQTSCSRLFMSTDPGEAVYDNTAVCQKQDYTYHIASSNSLNAQDTRGEPGRWIRYGFNFRVDLGGSLPESFTDGASSSVGPLGVIALHISPGVHCFDQTTKVPCIFSGPDLVVPLLPIPASTQPISIFEGTIVPCLRMGDTVEDMLKAAILLEEETQAQTQVQQQQKQQDPAILSPSPIPSPHLHHSTLSLAFQQQMEEYCGTKLASQMASLRC
ncbi:hypothetical protein AMATHDRAFT_48800 [Amanita thiersii Skay4041]|uniref:Uncharacterized protein n=1 Tax=Amanita thiersii Skay4041 TaxID=703135 RepID=A0A2A9NFG2_9AGAR|nr:hypothetical protein AMATHDRAFT_48800 [Amanita thiersii Skay4041]